MQIYAAIALPSPLSQRSTTVVSPVAPSDTQQADEPRYQEVSKHVFDRVATFQTLHQHPACFLYAVLLV